jgi:hypothetical protein
MAKLYNTSVSREYLLQHAGCLSQIAGVRLFEYNYGRAHGVKGADVRTGSGLTFTVLIDRCMDIAFADYCGKPIGWICKNGITAPYYFENGGIDFLRSFVGGLTTTCGLTQAGAPGIDGEEVLGIHGRISHLPAEWFSFDESWKGDDLIIRVQGRVRETCLYAENLVLHREILCHLGESKIFVHDIVENQGYNESPFMLMYHINFGYPVISEHSRLYSSAQRVEAWNEEAKKGNGRWEFFESPTSGYRWQAFLHHMSTERERAAAAVVNEKINFGAYVAYSPGQLPFFNEWKMMGQQDYVVGLEPGISIPEGRLEARKNGRLAMLEPRESRSFAYEIGVLDGNEEIAQFISKI